MDYKTSKQDELEAAEALIELLRAGRIFAYRNDSGEIVYCAMVFYNGQEMLDSDVAIAELNRDSN